MWKIIVAEVVISAIVAAVVVTVTLNLIDHD